MPTYEYTCKSCGDNIDVFQPFSAKPLKKHDVCGGDLQKVFHARGVVFKGSGWYAKDSKGSNAPSNGSKTDKTSASDTSSGSDSKSGSETGSKSEKSSSKSEKTSTSSTGSSSSD